MTSMRPARKREWDRAHKTITGNKTGGRHGGVKTYEAMQMQAMRDDGFTVEQIAERFNRHYNTVVKYTHPRYSSQVSGSRKSRENENQQGGIK